MSERNSISVFQDLVLRAPAGELSTIRPALIKHATGVWRHAPEAERRLSRNVVLDGDAIAFERNADVALPAASLALWSRTGTYEVSNIVPKEMGRLDYAQYNALLQEFVDVVVLPAAEGAGFSVEVTSGYQSVEEVASVEAAAALRQFSSAANKSTGSTHPADRKRWMRFLILAHLSGSALAGDFLARWLVEVDGWDEESAHDLAIEYEFAQDLLRTYHDERS